MLLKRVPAPGCLAMGTQRVNGGYCWPKSSRFRHADAKLMSHLRTRVSIRGQMEPRSSVYDSMMFANTVRSVGLGRLVGTFGANIVPAM